MFSNTGGSPCDGRPRGRLGLGWARLILVLALYTRIHTPTIGSHISTRAWAIFVGSGVQVGNTSPLATVVALSTCKERLRRIPYTCCNRRDPANRRPIDEHHPSAGVRPSASTSSGVRSLISPPPSRLRPAEWVATNCGARPAGLPSNTTSLNGPTEAEVVSCRP